jgi:transcriptional regulator PpsR
MEFSDQFDVTESLILGLADLIVVLHHKTHKVISVKTKGVELARLKLESWVGKKLSEWTELDSTQKLITLLKSPTVLESASAKELASDWRHINFLSPLNQSAPFMIKLFKFASEENLILCARDLGSMAKMQQKLMDAHRSMERDYLRLRHMESRYNTLFENSSEPLLIVDLITQKIVQANPSATRFLLRDESKKLMGSDLTQWFDAQDHAELEDMLSAAQSGEKTKAVSIKHGPFAQLLTLMPTLVVQEGGAQLMLRLVIKASIQSSSSKSSSQELLGDALQKAPYGFAMTDATGSVLMANEEFVNMLGAFSMSQVIGKAFESWLARGGVDWGVLSNNLKQLSTIRNFATELINQSNVSIEVEISAATLSSSEKRYGFFIRDVHRVSQSDLGATTGMASSVSQLAQLVGRMPMKDIVGETSDMIEKMCIQSALELTQNNRASAAEMLGLSRQSLYIKLHRYGLTDANDKH